MPEETARTQGLKRRLYIAALALILIGSLMTTRIAHAPGSFLNIFTLCMTLGWATVLLGLLLRYVTNQGAAILTYVLGVVLFLGILLTDLFGWPYSHALSFVAAGHLLSLWAFLAFGDKRGLQLSLGFYLLTLLLWGVTVYPVWSAGRWDGSALQTAWNTYVFYYALAPIYMGMPLAMATLQRNLSRRRIRELQHMVYVDSLTGLPNRRAFQEELEQAVRRIAEEGDSGALILLNVNEFSQINDEFGHAVGDQVLQQLAQRWVERLPGDMHLSRVSADEFAVICGQTDEQDILQRAERLLALSSETVSLRGVARSLRLRAGITFFSGGTQTPNQINIAADLAQAEARRRLQDIVIYTTELSRQAERRRRVLNALQGAQEREELHLVYQPVVDICTGRLISAEALLRWSSDITSPAPKTEEFITLAEEAGLMPMMGAWVLSRSLEQLRQWEAQGIHLPHLNVNVAPQELKEAGYAQRVLEELRLRGLPPEQLVLELTERTMVEAETIGELQVLRAAGVHIAVDDFGTGHSALGQLHLLPITAVKLDRIFTRALGEDRAAERLAGGVLALAKSLQLKVVAEGIETARQLQALAELGCPYGQGYQLSHPLTAPELAQLIAQRGVVEDETL